MPNYAVSSSKELKLKEFKPGVDAIICRNKVGDRYIRFTIDTHYGFPYLSLTDLKTLIEELEKL